MPEHHPRSSGWPALDSAPSRRIVLSGLPANAAASEMAIRLVDRAGNTLNRASVNDDGSCELPQQALASAHEVIFEPVGVAIAADQFRKLIETEQPVDVTVLLPATGQPANSAGPRPQAVAGPLPDHHPGGSGWPD